jgi:hypothetical protein
MTREREVLVEGLFSSPLRVLSLYPTILHTWYIIMYEVGIYVSDAMR